MKGKATLAITAETLAKMVQFYCDAKLSHLGRVVSVTKPAQYEEAFAIEFSTEEKPEEDQ